MGGILTNSKVREKFLECRTANSQKYLGKKTSEAQRGGKLINSTATVMRDRNYISWSNRWHWPKKLGSFYISSSSFTSMANIPAVILQFTGYRLKFPETCSWLCYPKAQKTPPNPPNHNKTKTFPQQQIKQDCHRKYYYLQNKCFSITEASKKT